MTSVSSGLPTPAERAALEHRFASLRDAIIDASPDLALSELLALRDESARLTKACRESITGFSLVASDPQLSGVRWMCTLYLRLARLARRVAEALARAAGPADDRVLRAMALAFYYMAESTKGEIAAGMKESRHHGRAHALMNLAIAGGRQREKIAFWVGGAELTCTIEALYLRALLLARVSGGGLTARQFEIFDTYFLNSIDVLAASDTPPADVAWRADLDGDKGLRRGIRQEAGPSLYLPIAPLESAYRAIVAEFHAGRVFPATGPVSRFPVEDHVAVLGLMRRTLRDSRRQPVARAKRHAVNATVEVNFGLEQIIAKGFVRAPRALATLASAQAPRAAPERRGVVGESVLASLYEPRRRTLRLVNISHTGIGLQGSELECGHVHAGDLIGIRLHDGEPIVVGKVVRRAENADGRVVLGVKRLTSAARVVACTPTEGDRTPMHFLYVPGDEPSGYRDAYLAHDATAADHRAFETRAAGSTFTMRFNRVRERGHGWALAGFQVLGRQAPRDTVAASA